MKGAKRGEEEANGRRIDERGDSRRKKRNESSAPDIVRLAADLSSCCSISFLFALVTFGFFV